MLNQQEQYSRVKQDAHLYRLTTPISSLETKIFSNPDLHPCGMKRAGVWAGAGPREFRVSLQWMLYLILSFNRWPQVAHKLR